jgi:hypothetical protein
VTGQPDIPTSAGISSACRAVKLPIRSCPSLAFGVSHRSSECFGRISVRSSLSSPLVVVGKGLKPTRNRSVGHGLGGVKQSLCCFQIFLASSGDLERHRAPRGSLAHGPGRFEAKAANCGHLPGEQCRSGPIVQLCRRLRSKTLSECKQSGKALPEGSPYKT